MPRPPLRFAVKGIYPGMGIVTVKRMPAHRDGMRYIHEHGGRLSNKYGMTLYVGKYTKGV